MASITVEIVSKTTSEAGTTFVLSASEEEIKRAGFVPYFVGPYFQFPATGNNELVCSTPYGSVVLGADERYISVGLLPFVPALTETHIDLTWMNKNMWIPYKLEKTTNKPNGAYTPVEITPSMNVGDTLVFYDTKPADPA